LYYRLRRKPRLSSTMEVLASLVFHINQSWIAKQLERKNKKKRREGKMG